MTKKHLLIRWYKASVWPCSAIAGLDVVSIDDDVVDEDCQSHIEDLLGGVIGPVNVLRYEIAVNKLWRG